MAAPVDEERLEIGLRAALLAAVLRRDAHVVPELAQRHVAAAGAKAQAALQRLLLHLGDTAAMPARRDARAPLEGLQLAAVDAVAERGFVLRLLSVAMHRGAVGVQVRELLAELEALALLAARRVARALEDAAAPGAAQFRGRRPAASKPQGMESAGSPASGAETVKMSSKYICTGSSTLAPIGKAVVGDVGPMMTSQRSKAWAKSPAISRRTFCAWT